MLRGLTEAVIRDGFALIPGHAPQSGGRNAFSQLGIVVQLPGVDDVQTLTPRERSDAFSNTYSGNYGLSEFPLHSDLAHWYVPPRYFALRCMVGFKDVATRLVDTRSLISDIGVTVLRRTLVQPRRPVGGNRPLLRLLEHGIGEGLLFRWDTLFIVPVTTQSALIFDNVRDELLARAAVAHISPCLLADPKDWNNLYHALGFVPKAPKFVPRSLDITDVLKRLQELIPDFTPELVAFAGLHMSRRNEELHSGSSPFDGVTTSSWLPTFYRTCAVLLTSMGESLETFFGRSEARTASAMIEASRDEAAKAIAKSVQAHKLVWEGKDPAERGKLVAQSSTWATKHQGHRVRCPSCGCDAVVSGSAIAPPIKTITNEDEITEVQEYLPSKFECIACGLKISGLSQLSACGLGNPYKATFVYDAAEYYAPEDPFGGYEPDFNEP